MSKHKKHLIIKRAYVTRDEALGCLGICSEAFDRMCVLNDVHPFVPSKSLLTNKGTRMQYRIGDIHRIRESEAFKKMQLKEKNRSIAEKYRKSGRVEKVENLPDSRTDFSKILLEKYPVFSDVFEDLGECISALVVADRILQHSRVLRIPYEQNISQKISNELSFFYLYLTLSNGCTQAFITNSCVYYSVDTMQHQVFWREAFWIASEEDILGINYNAIVYNAEYYACLLEKTNFVLFRDLGDVELQFLRDKRNEHSTDVTYHNDAPETVTPNRPAEKNGSDQQAPGSFGVHDLCKMHAGILEARNRKITDAECILPKKTGIFTGHTFYVAADCGPLAASLALIILRGGGSVTRNPDGCSIYLCETAPEIFAPEKEYAHPQMVYDSCNQGALQDTYAYRPGSILPQHVCPFTAEVLPGDLDTFNVSTRKKEALEEIMYHHK